MSDAKRVLIAVTLAACAASDATDPGKPPTAEPATIALHAGDNQTGEAGRALPVSPAVIVRDQAGRIVAGVPVVFAVDSGGGVVKGDTAITGADGVARAGAWHLGFERRNRLRASHGTLPPVLFTALSEAGNLADRAGRVVLPPGSRLELQSLRVINGLTTSAIGADGSFSLRTLKDEPRLALVHAPNDELVLMGWLYDQRLTLSARTTAEVLAFFDLGAYLLPDPRAREAARTHIAALSQLPAVESAIAAALATDAAALVLSADAVTAARRNLLDAVRALAATSAQPSNSVLVNPSGPKSGVSVDQTGLNQILLTNTYRRRAAAFIDRMSYVPSGGGNEVPAQEAGEKIPLKPVKEIRYVVGTAYDIVVGNLAYTPVREGPFPTPLHPSDAQATKYRALVVGCGGRPPAPDVSAVLTDKHDEAIRDACLETLALDFILPFVSMLYGVDYLGESHSHWVAFIKQYVPGDALLKAYKGDLRGAFIDFGKHLLLQSAVQEAFVEAIAFAAQVYAVENGLDPDVARKAVVERGKSVLKILKAVDIVLTATDIGIVAYHVGSSARAEQWDITVTPSRVSLTPPNSRIGLLEPQNLHAHVLDATGGGPTPTFAYRWSSTAKYGKLCVALPSGCYATTFDSSRDVVAYWPNASATGTDVITVEVFAIGLGGVRTPVGSASAEVEVYDGRIWLVPERISLSAHESHTFTAEVEESRLDGGVLSYRWSTTGEYGTLENGLNGAETSSNRMSYTARSDAEGSDFITVEVISTKDGIRKVLGQARAEVKVERRKTIIFGRWFVHVVPYMSGTFARECLVIYVAFNTVPEAKHYAIRGYHFYDPAYYRDRLEVGVTPPFQPFRECTGATYGTNGVAGVEYRHLITGGNGPAPVRVADWERRFNGMIVEVTVTY